MNKFDKIHIPTPKQGTPSDITKSVPTVSYPSNGTLEQDTNAEIDALKSAFQLSNDAQKQKDRQEVVNNTRFWFAVYFQDEEQKKEFLTKAGIKDESAGQYINGLDLAKTLNIDIQKKEMSPPKKFNGFSY
jgi:hypothetical protein